MSDDRDELGQRGLREMMRGASANGVASLRFPDGQMFMFTLEKLREIVGQLEESGKTEALIFVGFGPDVNEVQEN